MEAANVENGARHDGRMSTRVSSSREAATWSRREKSYVINSHVLQKFLATIGVRADTQLVSRVLARVESPVNK